MRTLVLWDIDRTLLHVRLGGGWYRQAVRELTGRDSGTMPAFAGRTDRWIARELLSGVGAEPTDELIDRLHATVVRIADADDRHLADFGVVLPGVPEVLRDIAGRGDVVQTLVTGNLRRIAALKLAAFGLGDHLDLAIGGYGEVSERRSELVAEAIDEAGLRHGTKFIGEAVVVVGDTPHDIHGALAHGARAVAVATGSFAADALAAAGAHEVLPDLGDTKRALAAILP
ncbi:MAG TPA: haloacid dehalogenase-like hydrolase [Pseudonocardiaceae bacterium]|jgi:phosphoglycolate phosphatase-like HAD superfamily hydrolase|nr:haloacid dehalogenase-like hydrolase [Pseudonocardiaceae bacterium]